MFRLYNGLRRRGSLVCRKDGVLLFKILWICRIRLHQRRSDEDSQPNYSYNLEFILLDDKLHHNRQDGDEIELYSFDQVFSGVKNEKGFWLYQYFFSLYNFSTRRGSVLIYHSSQLVSSSNYLQTHLLHVYLHVFIHTRTRIPPPPPPPTFTQVISFSNILQIGVFSFGIIIFLWQPYLYTIICLFHC